MNVPSRADLKKRRLELGLTQRLVAQRAGISQPLVARIESGSVDPRLSTLNKIVDVLNQAGREPGLKARDVMTKAVTSVRPKDTVQKAASLMNRGGFSMLPVLEYGRVVGSITERRLVEEMGRTEDLRSLSKLAVASFVQPSPPQVAPETEVEALSHLLDDHPLVLVGDRGRILGVVTKADLIRTLSPKKRVRA